MENIIHPSKELVRAYMVEREHARKPPSSPAEIRRQLGWRRTGDVDQAVLCHLFFLPGSIGQLTTLLAIEWLFNVCCPKAIGERH